MYYRVATLSKMYQTITRARATPDGCTNGPTLNGERLRFNQDQICFS